MNKPVLVLAKEIIELEAQLHKKHQELDALLKGASVTSSRPSTFSTTTALEAAAEKSILISSEQLKKKAYMKKWRQERKEKHLKELKRQHRSDGCKKAWDRQSEEVKKARIERLRAGLLRKLGGVHV